MFPLSDSSETAISLTGKLSALFLIIFILIVIFGEPKWMEEQIQVELNDIVNTIGEDTGMKIINRANDWYAIAFKETGIEKAINQTIGYDNLKEKNKGIRNMGKGLSNGLHKSLKTFWLMMYQSTVRLSVLAYWGVFLSAVIVASAIDGYNKRRVKQHNFGWTSVNVFRMSVKILVFLPFIIMTYLTFPVVPAYIQFFPVIILIVVAIAMNYLVSNMQKLF